MDEQKKPEIKQVTPAQEVLLSKLLKSKLLLDAEYREFREVLDKRVICSFDASVLIQYILGILRYRRHFSSKRCKAYKKCRFCNSRDKIMRIEKLHSNERFWSCENCFLNLDSNLFIAVNGFTGPQLDFVKDGIETLKEQDAISEENEAKADAVRKDPEALGYKIEE